MKPSSSKHYARKFSYEDNWDTHPTPPEWAQVLVRDYPSVKSFGIWEPACGDGRMSKALKAANCNVVLSTDLVDHGYGRFRSRDFLDSLALPEGCDAIVTNPPYKLAGDFVRRAINLPNIQLVAMLLKADFGGAIGRLDLTAGDARPYRIFTIVDRMPGELGKGGKYTFCHAWWVWLPSLAAPEYTQIEFVRAMGYGQI